MPASIRYINPARAWVRITKHRAPFSANTAAVNWCNRSGEVLRASSLVPDRGQYDCLFAAEELAYFRLHPEGLAMLSQPMPLPCAMAKLRAAAYVETADSLQYMMGALVESACYRYNCNHTSSRAARMQVTPTTTQQRYDQGVSLYRQGVSLYRQGMSKDEREDLSALVKDALAAHRAGASGAELLLQPIVDHLNDAGASEDLLPRLNERLLGVLNRGDAYRINFGDCGHFHLYIDGYNSEGSTGRICSGCAGDGWEIAENDGLYHPEDDLYWSEREDCWYSYDRDAEIDEEEEDGSDAGEGVHGWDSDSMQYLNEPEVESSATGEFTLGVEFECDPEDFDARRELASEIADNWSGEVIAKMDGSLNDAGLELVLAPMVLEHARDTLNQIEFPRGTRAWDAGCCGMHVHIDSRAFTRLTLAKFIAFWNAPGNAKLVRRVAGRHSSVDSQAKDYALAVEPSQTSTSIVQELKRGDYNASRYRLTNITPLSKRECDRLGVTYNGESRCYNTVELRGYRATMNPARRAAQLEMTHASVVFAREGSVRGMTDTAFRAWLGKSGSRYPALKAWLGVTHHKPKPGTVRPVEDVQPEAA